MSDEAKAEEDGGRRRRLALLLLVAIVVLLGAGIGSFTLLNSGGEDSPSEQVNVSLNSVGEATLLETNGIAPGDAGTGTLTLANDGERAGQVRLARTEITGLVDGERTDGATAGAASLSEALEVRMTFEYPDGTEVYVVGSASTYVTLADVNDSVSPEPPLEPGQAVTVSLEWRLPESTGNEVQGAGTVFDTVFQLRVPET